MTHIFDFCPQPPEWRLDWQAIDEAFDWVRAMRGCQQNPRYHAEGDVWVHTRMVCEALLAMDRWRQLAAGEREELFAAALWHDAAKPECTQIMADGRITSRGHARRGAAMARRWLWQAGVDRQRRERICALVRQHMVPLYLRDSDHWQKQLFGVSQAVRCDRLAILGFADARGRISEDGADLMNRHEFYEQACHQHDCFEQAYEFPSAHQRFQFFRGLETVQRTPAGPRIFLMSGLPASGKSTWAERHLADIPKLSMAEIRGELGVSLSDNQGSVIARGRERARQLLGRGESFVWDDLNLSRQLRDHLILLFAEYDAEIEVVYVETSESRLRQRLRQAPQSEQILHQCLERWEVPDLTEAHSVRYIDD